MDSVAILIVLLALLAIGAAVIFNQLVRKRQMTENGWSDIDVQLKRRADLIPSLVSAVKGYAAHERALFEEIAARRSAAMAAGDDPAARAVAESALARPVGRLVALAENYPDLKASENFLDLQRQLAETEDKIEMARRFYNGAVRELNILVASVPSNLIAGLAGFAPRAYFEIGERPRDANGRDERGQMICRALIILFLALAPLAVRAGERITDFDLLIEVQKSGDILVTETISVNAEGDAIRRGIFRDLPRYYLKGARELPYRYDIWKVTRNGAREYYLVEIDGAAFRIRIGEADVFLKPGAHQYVIAYLVRNQVRYFDSYDEVYWNATGNYWSFPIDRARVRLKLPEGADATQRAAYTGAQGATARDYVYRFGDQTHIFETTRSFAPGEGLTVAVGFAKGVVDPPSRADNFGEWWTVNASLVILGAAALLIGALYAFFWRRVGRDPAKGPVFPRYEPPAGLAPAAVHQIFHRGARGYTALIASLINLGVKKRLRIDTEKKKTVLTRLADEGAAGLAGFEKRLEADLFGSAREISFGGKYNASVTSAYTQLTKALSRQYGAPYFKWNREFLLIGILVSIGAIVLAENFVIAWTFVHIALAGALVVMAIAAAYFLPAPTAKGQDTRTEIEGFRLYLETAEKLQLNAVEIGKGAPPPMTIERYERFLPYAVALGVEKPWTEHFERLMPKEAAEYQPYWSTSHHGGGNSLASLNSALVSGLSSGVASAMPQSSSSSGSSGGGSSGGGGGGGGGGGW